MPQTPHKVSVIAPARLHMGFIDLSGALGRYFGSIGVALNEISLRLSLVKAHQRQISGPLAQRAASCLSLFSQALGVDDSFNMTIEMAIPEHVGLGSGTQLSLAIGAALNAYYGLGLTIRDIAALLERGQRSGIGIGVFEQGGVVVDGGRGEQTITPPLIVRMALPEAWRFILVFDSRAQGLHGSPEIQAFQTLPPFAQTQAAHLCYLLLMQGLPALAEQNLTQFGAVITELQQAVGTHFAPAQGGGLFTSKEVGQAIHWLAQQGAVAIGQTSWGPTGFCLCANAKQAHRLLNDVRQQFAAVRQLSFLLASARNEGAAVLLE